MSTPAKKTATITVRTEDQLKADLEGLAAADDRSLSAYIVNVLRAHVASVKGAKR